MSPDMAGGMTSCHYIEFIYPCQEYFSKNCLDLDPAECENMIVVPDSRELLAGGDFK